MGCCSLGKYSLVVSPPVPVATLELARDLGAQVPWWLGVMWR